VEEAAPISSLFYPFVNFAILVGALFYFLKTPTKSFVKGRHLNLKDELDRVQEKLLGAQRQYQEYSQRLSSMGAEITTLVQEVRAEAESAKVRILTEARRTADQLVIDSKRATESMFAEFKDQVRIDLANQVIVRAEAILKTKMTGDVREAMKKDFSKQVESVR
jgi:F0F1-type ATP synthase membrane subunit b/b'